MQGTRSHTRRYSFRHVATTQAPTRPMSELNITPLIDVLLVLLVMLMLSIPIATHKVEIELPKAGPANGEPPVINRLRLNANGQTFWNGKPLGGKELKTELVAMARDPNRPQLHFETDARARYEEFDHLIATVKRSGVREIGFVGNHAFERWDQN